MHTVKIFLRGHTAFSPVVHEVVYPSKVGHDQGVLTIHMNDDDTAQYPLDVLWCWTIERQRDAN